MANADRVARQESYLSLGGIPAILSFLSEDLNTPLRGFYILLIKRNHRSTRFGVYEDQCLNLPPSALVFSHSSRLATSCSPSKIHGFRLVNLIGSSVHPSFSECSLFTPPLIRSSEWAVILPLFASLLMPFYRALKCSPASLNFETF